MSSEKIPPILRAKDYAAPSVFEPANLLREARRQKGLAEAKVPAVCLLDPDGDILRALRCEGRATLSPAWACYHTDLYEFAEALEITGFPRSSSSACNTGRVGRPVPVRNTAWACALSMLRARR